MLREPVGVLIMRVWLEPGSPTPFRATVSMTEDVGSAAPVSTSFAEPGEVIAAVRRFLAEMAGGDGAELAGGDGAELAGGDGAEMAGGDGVPE